MGGIVTISGSPDATINVPTTYTFDVTTGAVGNTSVCADDTETITINVNPQSELTFTGTNTLQLNQSVCFGGDIEDVNFVAGGGADNVTLTVTAPPGAPALGWTTATNIRRDPAIPDSFILHGTATPAAPIANPITYSYQVETVNLYGCNPEIVIGGTITVFPTVTVTLPGNVTENDPLCFRGPGSIELSPAAVSGGITSQQQQTRIEIDNNFAIGDQITFTIAGVAMNSYTVQGIDNGGNLVALPGAGIRPLSRVEILPLIADIINDPVTGSNFAIATANSPGPGQLTLVAKTTGVPFTTAVSFSVGSTGGLVGAPTITVPNQTLNYEYYWRRSDAAGMPLSSLDVTDSSTYETNTSNGGLTLNVVNVSATQYYIVTVVANNCQVDSDVMSLTSPTEVDLSVSSICPDDITAVATGGSGAYLYELFDRNGTLIDTSAFASPGPYSFGSITGIALIGGFQYTLIATDTNGCGGSSTSVGITLPVDLSIDESTITVTPADCNGNGSITIDQGGTTVTGGSTAGGDYSNLVFEWTGSGLTRTTQNLADVPPGDYTLTVTDISCGPGVGLSTLVGVSDPIRILPAELPVLPLDGQVGVTSNPANCSDGFIEVQFTGLTSSTYNYEFRNPLGTVIGSGNNILPSVNTIRIENLDRAGIYTLEMTIPQPAGSTSSPCIVIEEYEISGSDGPIRAINPITPNQANFTTTDIICNGQSNGIAITEIAGGTPPYSYSINGSAYNSPGEGFTTLTSVVTITSINSITGSITTSIVSYTSQQLNIDNLSGGTYNIKVKDSNGCVDGGGLPVELDLGSFTINEPDLLEVELNSTTTTAVDCTNNIKGSLGINISGGTTSPTGYSILWQLTDTDGSVIYKRTTRSQLPNGDPNPSGLTINDLDYAGDYTVIVTDAGGCIITKQITLENGSTATAPFEVGSPIITQPGCNSDETGSIELQLSGGSQPYDIKWYRLAVASDNALSLTSTQTGTPSATVASETIIFSDGGYVSMNKDGFYIIDNLEPGKYKAIIKDNTSCEIFTKSGVIKSSTFNMVKQKVFNREVLDCESGIVEADFSFRLTGTSLAYNIFLDGELVYGGSPSGSSSATVVSPTFASSIIKSGSSFIIRGLSEGRHIVEAQDSTNTNCSLDYAFDIETYVPITFEGETEFEFDVCENGFPFELDTTNIIGGNPIIDDNDNVIYNLRWTYTPSDPNQPGSSFLGRTSFEAGRGTYQLIISDGTCESEPIDFVFSGDVNVLSIGGLLSDANGSLTPVQGVSCELGARDGRISIDIVGGQEPYDISWEIFDASNPRLTPVSSTISGTTNQVSPWRPLDGSYPGLDNFDGFSTLNELPAGLYRYTIRSGSTCPNPIDTPFNYLRDVISVDDDTTLVITDGPFVDYKLCEGLPGLIILDAVNNSETNSALNFFYIDTNGTEDIGDDGQPVALNGNTTKLDEDTYQILIDAPFEYGKIVITTDQGCGVEAEFNLALGDPFFSYTSPSFEQVNEIPAREDVTFRDESEGEFSRLEWNFGDNSESIILDVSGTSSGVTQVNHSYGNSGTYYPTLTIYNEIGCFESVTNPITIGRGYSIYVPNVFTPNNDCLNDYFRPLFTGFESLIFNVFDNRGNLIYSEEAQDGSVDRSDCPDSIDSFGNGKSILGWDGNGFDGLTMDAFSPYFVYTIYAVPLNRVTPDQTIERSGIFTILK